MPTCCDDSVAVKKTQNKKNKETKEVEREMVELHSLIHSLQTLKSRLINKKEE